ncbi:MAG: CoA transferase [Proteobacteria bacterium]|nr:CoA transferase [Pseudomonadota bacterium]MBK8958407.1 CoA transferase [Pseudomonadota bacterium]
MNTPHPDSRPLAGMRVIEAGQLLAGPFTGTILGYFGAEVIKVEPPDGGDPIRGWREMRNGTSLWWASLARNKKCVTLDLRTERGRALLADLAARADVFVENFRPGIMEKWGLGPDALKARNPGLIYTRISGYGQTGPNAPKAGFASVCEAYGGFRYVNGFPDQPPVRPNLSMGDTLAGIHAALGVLLAYIGRHKDGLGQVVDVAIFEAIFNLMEGVIPEYDGNGVIRQPSGSTLTGIVPSNTYRCADGKLIVIGANTNPMFKRLVEAMGKAGMASDPRLADNAGRVRHQDEVDGAVQQWASSMNAAEALAILDEAGVAAGPIYDARDMFEDPHYRARGLFQEVTIDGQPLNIPAIVPLLERTPGKTDWPGPGLGAYNDAVYGELLGLDAEAIAELKTAGVI